jgi:hypothetical protein
MWRLFGQGLRGPAMRYDIVVDFLGFRAEHANVPEPTYQEFRRGQPILTREIPINFRWRGSGPNSPD